MSFEPTDGGETEGPFTRIDEGGVDNEIGDERVGTPGAFGRLLDGSITGPSVDTLKAEYNIAYHWALTLRGVIRAATGDGVPPLWEITIGTIMGAASLARGEEELGSMKDMASMGDSPEAEEIAQE